MEASHQFRGTQNCFAKQNKPPRKTLLFLGGTLFVALSVAVVSLPRKRQSFDVRQQATEGLSSETPASLKLQPLSSSPDDNGWVYVDVLLDTGGREVGGVKLIIKSDREVMELYGVTPGGQISQSPPFLPQLLRDSSRDREVATVNFDQGLSLEEKKFYRNSSPSQPGVVARLKFLVLRLGPATISFKFNREPRFGLDSSGDTDVIAVVNGRAVDILGQAQDLNFTILPHGPTPPPPASAPLAPPELEEKVSTSSSAPNEASPSAQ